MLRVGMTNPPYIMEHLDAIAECLKHPNVFAFLHVPVQVIGLVLEPSLLSLISFMHTL